MTRDTVLLPRLPAGADDQLRLKRDIAVAVFALHKRCTLQQASEALDGVLDVADKAIENVMRGQGSHL